MDVLGTNKTGTLTEARIRLQKHVDIDGPTANAALAYLASFFASVVKGPLDEAVLRYEAVDCNGYEKIAERSGVGRDAAIGHGLDFSPAQCAMSPPCEPTEA